MHVQWVLHRVECRKTRFGQSFGWTKIVVSELSQLLLQLSTDLELFSSSSRGLTGANHTLLHVYYTDLVSSRFRRNLFQNFSDVLAMFGGLTGLFVGLSFISIYELCKLTVNRLRPSELFIQTFNTFTVYIFIFKPYFNRLATRSLNRRQSVF